MTVCGHLVRTCINGLHIWSAHIISDLHYKSFMTLIYDHNDNGLYYITTIVANLTTIVANLALARSVNYDCKVSCKLKCTFTIVNYDPKPFIAQATEWHHSQHYVIQSACGLNAHYAD